MGAMDKRCAAFGERPVIATVSINSGYEQFYNNNIIYSSGGVLCHHYLQQARLMHRWRHTSIIYDGGDYS